MSLTSTENILKKSPESDWHWIPVWKCRFNPGQVFPGVACPDTANQMIENRLTLTNIWRTKKGRFIQNSDKIQDLYAVMSFDVAQRVRNIRTPKKYVRSPPNLEVGRKHVGGGVNNSFSAAKVTSDRSGGTVRCVVAGLVRPRGALA
ncbi:hypothetical protein ACJJTC_014639 [Scirpophaga incertulas]